MTEIVNDEILLELAKEEMGKYANGYSQNGLVLGNMYSDKLMAIYDLLVKIYGKPYLKVHGLELKEDEEETEE